MRFARSLRLVPARAKAPSQAAAVSTTVLLLHLLSHMARLPSFDKRVAGHGYISGVSCGGSDTVLPVSADVLPQAPLLAHSAALDSSLAPMVCWRVFVRRVCILCVCPIHGMEDTAAQFDFALSLIRPSWPSILVRVAGSRGHKL